MSFMADLKRNKINKFNINCLELAFQQAKINLGCTKTNPSVGCVVEKNGSIISTGSTSINGRPHAEYNALNLKKDFKDCTLYVTLEPCNHFGKTPPCVKSIIKSKIKKVFYSIEDFDLRTTGKSENILRKNKIIVKKYILKSKGNDFYKSHELRNKKKIPLVDAKLAISKDFFTVNKKNKWITNKESRLRGQYYRSTYDCLISTSNSINKDNSSLDCRLKGLEHKSPDIVIIDRFFKIKKNLRLFKSHLNRKIKILTISKNKKKISFFKKKKIDVISLKKMDTRDDYLKIFKNLSKKYTRVLVESGLTYLNFLIKSKLIDNLYIFKSGQNLKKNGRNNDTISHIKKIKLKSKISVYLYGDSLFKIKLK